MKVAAFGGDMHYMGDSNFMLRDKKTNDMVERKINRVGMISAGSGITPMYQVNKHSSDNFTNLDFFLLVD